MQPQKHSEPILTVSEVAGLIGCSPRYIRSQLGQGKIKGEKRLNERNLPVYHIPLSALNTKAQARYLKKNPIYEGIEAVVKQPVKAKTLEEYSENERQQIHFWTSLVQEWQKYRQNGDHENKLDANHRFIAYAEVAYSDIYKEIYGIPLALSKDKLYRRYKAVKENDLDGLIEKRGKSTKGVSMMDDIMWEAFLYYYLDESVHPITKCIEYTGLWLEEKYPELLDIVPSYHSFYRRVKNDIPEPLAVLGREGEKAYQDRCAPYIRRAYDEMESNDYWVADTHTFDVMTEDGEGVVHRLYLTAFFDARSGIFTGATITTNPGSQAVLTALRKGIFKYGIPRYIYVDNGREFLTYDIGGLGHRQKKRKKEVYEPPAVFQRLGITMINAKVRNARAKIIERRFLDVKNDLSRLFQTFTGGNVLEKPERLKHVLKDGKIPSDVEFTQDVELLLDWYFNQQEYGGAVMRDRGKRRIDVFYDNLHTQRRASEVDLNLMLMRSSRPQKVGRTGVNHKVGLIKIDYWNQDFVSTMFGHEVYYRYDPENLSAVRVYDLEDRFLMSLDADNETVCKYGCSQDELRAANKKIRAVEKSQKEALKNSGLALYDRISAFDLIIGKARRNKQSFVAPTTRPQVIELTQVTEQPMLKSAVGYDIDTMLKNAEIRNKEDYDE